MFAAMHQSGFGSSYTSASKKLPKRLNDIAQSHNFADPMSRCRQQYFDILDTTACAVRSRFEQEGFKVFHHIEKVLMMALNPFGIKVMNLMELQTAMPKDVKGKMAYSKYAITLTVISTTNACYDN